MRPWTPQHPALQRPKVTYTGQRNGPPAQEFAAHQHVFLRDDTLFAYFEYWGEDLARDLAAISADPETQRWWRFTGPCQEPWPDWRQLVRPGPGVAPERA
jgi:L-rhamnose mutarotase